MPPARPRVVDDARSETSVANTKDRAISHNLTSKSKKNAPGPINNATMPSKLGLSSHIAVTTSATANGAGDASHELPHMDWLTFPTSALHSYRSAYRLQIPSAYTQSHADLLYRSCDIALQAPSQVLARKKAHDLKQYRKKQAQQDRVHANGISKSSKSIRVKESRRTNIKRKDAAADPETVPRPSIEEPPSPTSNSHPSLQESASNPADTGSRKSPRSPSTNESAPIDERANIIPHSLNQSNPENTISGSLCPTSLSTSIRKHFNAQQVNEAETIARFSYVARQQGSNSTSRVQPLAQRTETLPLPTTAAENIAATAEAAAAQFIAATSLANGISIVISGAPAAGATTAATKANAHNAHSISSSRSLGGQHVEIEGGYGDGKGWIMGTTNCGRQVRVSDGGGTGAFRLRFRP